MKRKTEKEGREGERGNRGRKIGMPYIIFSLSLKRVRVWCNEIL